MLLPLAGVCTESISAVFIAIAYATCCAASCCSSSSILFAAACSASTSLCDALVGGSPFCLGLRGRAAARRFSAKRVAMLVTFWLARNALFLAILAALVCSRGDNLRSIPVLQQRSGGVAGTRQDFHLSEFEHLFTGSLHTSQQRAGLGDVSALRPGEQQLHG